jgi:DNA end-binding protein Ku
MARGLWNGAISFGLINIPVEIMSAKDQKRISFRMLDKNDFSPIGYKQINKTTGREVQRKNIVKGYEYSPNQFVVMTEADFEKANPKATKTLDIQDFVDIEDVDPLMFETPYYLIPGKSGEKGYLLLRKTLEHTKKAAITQFVMHKKEHLGAIMPRGDYLILEVLRYAHEVKELDEAKFLEDVDLSKVRISDRELKMAESLVRGMTERWQPRRYKDTYQDDLLRLIEAKIKGGKTETPPELEVPEATKTNTVDLSALLERSLQSRGSRAAHHPALREGSSSRSAAASKKSTSARKSVSTKSGGTKKKAAHKSKSVAKAHAAHKATTKRKTSHAKRAH